MHAVHKKNNCYYNLPAATSALSTPAAIVTRPRRIGAAALLRNIKAKTGETGRNDSLYIEPTIPTETNDRRDDGPIPLDLLANSPPTREHQTKKRRIHSIDKSANQATANPFEPINLQSMGQEEVLKIEPYFDLWTNPNNIATAMEVVGAAAQVDPIPSLPTVNSNILEHGIIILKLSPLCAAG
jgi:hypothetical protein